MKAHTGTSKIYKDRCPSVRTRPLLSSLTPAFEKLIHFFLLLPLRTDSVTQRSSCAERKTEALNTIATIITTTTTTMIPSVTVS